MPENRHKFKVEEFRTPSIQQCFKYHCFGHKVPNCTKKPNCGVCGEAHSHKNCPNREKRSPKCANCRGSHVANYTGCPAYKDQAFRQHVVQNQVFYASILKQASPPPPSNTLETLSNWDGIEEDDVSDNATQLTAA